jgi:hypothetical protein
MTPLHYNANRPAAAFARVVIFGMWAVLAAVTPLGDLAELPWELTLPTGIVALLPPSWQSALWTTGALAAVRWTVVGAGALCVFSPRAVPLAGPIVCLAATLFQSLVRSYGHVNHGEIAALLSLYVVTVFSWLNSGKRIAAWQSQGFNPYTGPLVGIVLTICMTYTLIGFQRAGLEVLHAAKGANDERVFFTHAMAAHCVARSFGEGSYEWARGMGAIVGKSRWIEFFLNAGYVLVTIIECTSLLAFTSKWYRIMFLG